MKYILFIFNLFLLLLSIFNTKNFLYTYPELISKNYIHNNNKLNTSLAPMLEKILPSVVNIYTQGNKLIKNNIPKEFEYFFGPNIIPKNNNIPFEGIGSGVIIDSKNGYIITNYHVINKANKIKIKLNDNREFNCELIGNDDSTDIAVLKILNPENLIEIKIANSDNIRVGDFVVAIGNPFGLGQTATSGIISALGRSGLKSSKLENYIQTDASINKGNSGGALVNINGELIGMNTAILAPSGGNIGIGFAIPSNIIKNLSYQIIKYGEVKRGQLGIKGTELNSEIAKAFKLNINKGAFVSEVIPNTPAYKYGIKSGDIILGINGKNINSFSELKVKIGITLPGEIINLNILRNGKNISLSIKLDNYFLQKQIEKIPFLSFKGAILKNYKQGIQVDNIIENSEAYLIGLRKGDLIIGLNKEKIDNLDKFKKELNNNSNLIVLDIIRNNLKVFLIFKNKLNKFSY